MITTGRLSARVAAPLALAIALCIPAAAAAQGDTADCKVFEIEAKDGDGGIDPALEPLKKKLSKPPFSSWKTFVLLAKHSKKVTRMKALNLGLQPGGKLSLLYRDRSEEKNKKVRLRLTFQLDDKKGKRTADGTINLDSGDYYMIGGAPLDSGGTYILAITCSAP